MENLKPNSDSNTLQSEVATNSNSKVSQSRDHKRTTVRFTDDEYERVINDAKLSGLSIPMLLKKSHFTKKKLQLLLSEVERHLVCKELRAIGNNVNQIARRVNSGIFEGWHKEFEEVFKMISELHQMAAGAYGIR